MRASATCARLLPGHSVLAAVALVGVVALGAAAEPPAEPQSAPFTLASRRPSQQSARCDSLVLCTREVAAKSS